MMYEGWGMGDILTEDYVPAPMPDDRAGIQPMATMGRYWLDSDEGTLTS